MYLRLAFTVCYFCVAKVLQLLGRYDWKLLVITYGGPFLYSMLPFITNDYGHDGAWCWIKETPGNAPKIMYNLVPLVVVLVLNIAVLSIIYFQVRASRAANNSGSAGETVIKRALLFVLAYIIQFTPLTIYTVVAISGGTVSFGYILAVVTTINLGGLLNGLAYGRGAVERIESEKRGTIAGTQHSLVTPGKFKTLIGLGKCDGSSRVDGSRADGSKADASKMDASKMDSSRLEEAKDGSNGKSKGDGSNGKGDGSNGKGDGSTVTKLEENKAQPEEVRVEVIPEREDEPAEAAATATLSGQPEGKPQGEGEPTQREGEPTREQGEPAQGEGQREPQGEAARTDVEAVASPVPSDVGSGEGI